MKIIYLPGPYPFCYYYRGYLPGVYSKQMVVNEFLNRDFNTEKIKRQVKEADVVVLERPMEKEKLQLVRTLKAAGKKVIFENDDTYEGIPLERLDNNKQRELAKEMAANLKEVLRECDGAIASTNVLADEYAKINPNVVVLKNCIDPLDEFKCRRNTTGKFRVGLLGSVTTNDDYVHIKDQIKRLDERGDITFVIMGVKNKDGSYLPTMKEDYDFWSSLTNIEWHTYVPINEAMMTYADLALDLAIIPRKDHYFNKCKSNLKFLEMSLLRIPVLAQGFKDKDGPYDSEEDYMELVYNNDTWYEHIMTIKLNHAYYRRKAERAHDYVLENYNITTYANEWTNKIKQLCK